MTDNRNGSVADWLSGAGEMGPLILEKDWSRTSLGPLETWPESLRTAVSLCLASNFPINLIWGPDRIQIYNDGYWPICGEKHPHSMGQDFKECWFSAWDAIGEAFENARSGKADFLVNERMFLDRHGYLEETFFTFSFSPIRDESGGVGGLFHPVTEMTHQTLTERRLKVLRDLADHTAEAKSVTAVCTSIGRVLDEHPLEVPFALLYLLDEEQQQATLAGHSGLTPDHPAAARHLRLDASRGWPLAEAARDRQIVEVEVDDGRFGSLEGGQYPEPPRTALVLPIVLSGVAHTFGLFVTGVSARRALDESYRTFYQMLREGVTTALTNARAYEAERQRAESLAELDRAKTAFFSNVSHEFRTPLTLMLGPVERLLAGAEGELPPAAARQLEVVHRNSLRLLKLVGTMLDFSRIEAGRIRASYEPVDLSACTADLASVFRSAIEKAGMRLVVDCPPLSESVYVDPEMWEKIVLNLLSNAFKFTLDGEITLRVEEVDGHARLCVSDTGVGIPDDELPHVFERFHRVENARGRTYEGTGIGLALVRELAALHGGTVSVESEEEVGSTFAVAIPMGRGHLDPDRIGGDSNLAPTTPGAEAFVEEALRWLPEETHSGQAPPASDVAVATHPSVKGARVLWADDNADMREYVVRLLGSVFDVTAVADGQAALEAARSHPPELVLTDVMMPRLDGMGLLRAMRADPDLQGTPVILLSARAGEEARIEGMEAGADDYLTKPFSARELVARVESHVRMARLRREGTRALEELNETLESRVRQRTWQVRDLTRRLTMAEQEERRRISQILHDDLQQLLYAVSTKMAILCGDLQKRSYARLESDLNEARVWVDTAVATTRQLTIDINPPILQDEGLANALEWLQQQMKDLHGMQVEVEAEHAFYVEDDDLHVLLFQIIRELLFNVKKHAGTDRATVRLRGAADRVEIDVVDEGRGFDAELAAARAETDGTFGLFSVRERLNLLGGRMTVRSRRGEGTHITLSVPMGIDGRDGS